jgi:RecA-family ATPase
MSVPIIGQGAVGFTPPRRMLDLILNPPDSPPFWIECGILPRGGVMIMGGQAKLGKTFLLLSLLKSLLFGEPLFDVPQWIVKEPCRVLYIDRELGPHIFYDRISLAFERYVRGCAPDVLQRFHDNAWFMSRDDDSRHINLSTDRGKAILLNALDIVKPHVLFFDPIGKLHSFEENDAGGMNQLFLAMEQIRNEHIEREMSIVFSHHFGKLSSSRDSGRRPLDPYNFRGSTRWYDDPDTILTARKTREHRISDEHKWWECEVDLDPARAGMHPDPFVVHVNEFNDRCVHFQRWLRGEANG